MYYFPMYCTWALRISNEELVLVEKFKWLALAIWCYGKIQLDYRERCWTWRKNVFGSSSNHDDDGCKNVNNLHIWQWKTTVLHTLHVQLFARFARAVFFPPRETISFGFVWRRKQMLNYVFLPLKPNDFESFRNDCRNAKLYFQMRFSL